LWYDEVMLLVLVLVLVLVLAVLLGPSEGVVEEEELCVQDLEFGVW